MRVRNIKIGVKALRAVLDETREAMEHIAAGQAAPKIHDVNFTSYEAMRKLLTPRRLELLHIIKEQRPDSIDELVQVVGRDAKNINDDLALLSNVGLLELRKTTKGRKRVVPHVTVDKLQVEITV
jgi:predicted transcriptional regulator